MSVIFKKTYQFAVKSALYITFFSTGLVALLTYLFFDFSLLFCFVFAVSIGSFSFFVIQYRLEHFIFKKVKNIYDDVSLFESSTFINQPVTTDMSTLKR